MGSDVRSDTANQKVLVLTHHFELENIIRPALSDQKSALQTYIFSKSPAYEVILCGGLSLLEIK